MPLRATYSRADRYLREHPRAYALVLLFATFTVATGIHLSFGETLREALIVGALYGVTFALAFGLLSYVIESRTG